MFGLDEFFAWWFSCLTMFLGYLLMAGLGYLVFYVLNSKKYFHIKIQKKSPFSKIIKLEIFYSILTLIIYSVSSWLIFYFYNTGDTKIYIDINQHGYLYLVFSILFMIIVHDTYFYWTHRLIHLPKIFKIAHKVHHISHNPTPWSAFSFHPIEAIISIGYIPIFIFLMPSHPFALFAFLSFMTFINITGHLGYEIFSIMFMRSVVGKWLNASTFHNLHHRHSKYNFGLYFTFWDRLMGTFNEGIKE